MDNALVSTQAVLHLAVLSFSCTSIWNEQSTWLTVCRINSQEISTQRIKLVHIILIRVLTLLLLDFFPNAHSSILFVHNL